MIEIDAIDRRILSEVQRDASVGLEELGDRVGLSRNACWRRIRILEKSGVIRGRVALLDPELLGVGLTVFMQIRAAAHEAAWMATFTDATRHMPQIQSVFRMTGDLDYLIKARVADMADYDRLYQTLIARVPMRDVAASFVMEEIKDTTALAL
ncbi:MAG: Lrp/AsnC family transcriptional regulator [Pseudomonadota bacterium]